MSMSSLLLARGIVKGQSGWAFYAKIEPVFVGSDGERLRMFRIVRGEWA